MRRQSYGMMIILCASMISAAHAEYYLDYPEPTISNVIDLTYHKKPHYKKAAHHMQRQAHSSCSSHRNSPDITVYYVYYDPAYTCAEGWESDFCYNVVKSNMPQKLSRGYVTFKSSYTSNRNTIAPNDRSGTYDHRTADDDVMHYPDMNNQY